MTDRLINADKLYMCFLDKIFTKKDWAYYEIEEVIDSAPTVEPIKHGHWNEEMGGGYVCSLCERFSDFATNYCPHCGAKMKIDEKRD